MGLGRALLLWCVLLPCYLLLAGAVSRTELCAGVLACLLVVGVALAVHRGERRRLHARVPVAVVGRTLLSLATDSIRVGVVLLHAMRRRPAGRVGAVVEVPFRSGVERPADAGRRGVVTIAASLAPNGFVLAVPRTREILLMHTLAPVPPPADRNWPV